MCIYVHRSEYEMKRNTEIGLFTKPLTFRGHPETTSDIEKQYKRQGVHPPKNNRNYPGGEPMSGSKYQ